MRNFMVYYVCCQQKCLPVLSTNILKFIIPSKDSCIHMYIHILETMYRSVLCYTQVLPSNVWLTRMLCHTGNVVVYPCTSLSAAATRILGMPV